MNKLEELIELLEDAEHAKLFSQGFIKGFLEPAFGAISKAEIDNLVFSLLIEIKAIDKESQAYEICRTLNVTPSKARNLLFQWQLRNTDDESKIRDDLLEALKKVRFGKEGNQLVFGIESPILREELRSRLKEIGIYADTSFASEIVRMSVEHFVDFLDKFMNQDNKEKILDSLVKDGQLKDKSFKAVTSRILKGIAKRVAGEVADDMADLLGDTVRCFMDGDSESIKETLGDDFYNELLKT